MTEEQKIQEYIAGSVHCNYPEVCDEFCNDWSHFGDGPCGYFSDDPDEHEKMLLLAKKRTELLMRNFSSENEEFKPLSYSEKLKDPRWQRKRLEILNRDEFTCQRCGDDSSPLVVHHLSYSKGNPWNINNSQLITYCEDCHRKLHNK
jgi:hypothetical protein